MVQRSSFATVWRAVSVSALGTVTVYVDRPERYLSSLLMVVSWILLYLARTKRGALLSGIHGLSAQEKVPQSSLFLPVEAELVESRPGLPQLPNVRWAVVSE